MSSISEDSDLPTGWIALPVYITLVVIFAFIIYTKLRLVGIL